MQNYIKGQGFPPIKLDETILQRLGFIDSGEKDFSQRTKWRMKVPYYNFEIQMVLGHYPKTNPNCGILSLYSPEDVAVGTDKKGNLKQIKIKKREIPVAWYVDTPERLQKIIVSLSQINI